MKNFTQEGIQVHFTVMRKHEEKHLILKRSDWHFDHITLENSILRQIQKQPNSLQIQIEEWGNNYIFLHLTFEFKQIEPGFSWNLEMHIFMYSYIV